MAFIDSTVVNVALPALQTSLHATVSDVQWVVESYALMLAALLLVGGSLGDRYGRRKVYLCGTVLFAAASAWCGLSNSVDMLIFARAVQGLGAAMLVPGSLAIISASFPEETRGKAIGTWSGFTAITAAIGPVIGGWLVEHASWRWVFFLNLPLALAVVALSLMRVPESRNDAASRHLDWPGALLATVGLGAVTYALIEFPNRTAHAPHLILLVSLVGAAALAGFLVVEERSHAPMVSLTLFRSRNFSGANLLTLFFYAALGGMLFFLPMNLIEVQHDSATEAGAALLPLVALLFALSRWSGGLVARYGARLPLTIGPLIFAAGVVLFARQGVGGSYWTTVFPATVVMGFGMTMCVAPLTTTVMNAVDQADAGLASGVNNAVSRIGGLLAVAVFGVILLAGFNRGLDRRLDRLALTPQARQQADAQRPLLAAASDPDPRVQRAVDESFVAGYRWVIWVSVALAVVSSGCAWCWIDPAPQA